MSEVRFVMFLADLLGFFFSDSIRRDLPCLTLPYLWKTPKWHLLQRRPSAIKELPTLQRCNLLFLPTSFQRRFGSAPYWGSRCASLPPNSIIGTLFEGLSHDIISGHLEIENKIKPNCREIAKNFQGTGNNERSPINSA